MKLNKLTPILINVLLVLCVAVLLKFLFNFPKAASAATQKSYQVVAFDPRDYLMESDRPKNLQKILNEKGAAGWTFVSTIEGSKFWLIFEQ